MDQVMKIRGSTAGPERASVSVIIPCYRCADTIRRAIDSVMNQTLPPEEIILVEDISNDADVTLSALESLRQSYQEMNIKVIRLEQNSGPGSARNAGWAIATQPYLAFLDADDSWHPQKLEIHYGWMLEHLDVVMSGHSTVKISSGEGVPSLTTAVTAIHVSARRLLFKNYFPTRTVMLKRELPYRFIAGKRYAEDLLLWLTIAFNGHSLWRINQSMAYTYKDEFGEGGLTGNLRQTQQGLIDTYQQLLSLGYISFLVYILASSFSLMKYFRRLLLVKWRAYFIHTS